MNFENIGLNVCKIKSKTDIKGFKDVLVSIANREQCDLLKHKLDEIQLDSGEVMQHLPYRSAKDGNLRQILYVSGASGSGKSVYTASYMREYVKCSLKIRYTLFPV